ncbi:MAG: hypothetical protein KatS3mg014_0500 [Actinomycetota bacterium]|nr:MAG: hypothetical protein KatS3mg014_0500 [Actinomycetota bacterium]
MEPAGVLRRVTMPALTLLAVLALVVNPASAWERPEKVNLAYIEVVGPGPSLWEMSNEGAACATVDEAFTPVSDGALGADFTQSDAFDDGLVVTVQVGSTTKDLSDRDGFLEVGEDDVLVDGIKVGGLKLSRTERVLDTSPTLRSLISFRNPTDAPVTAQVWWDSNLGSDGGEAARATASGDTTFDVSDGWVVTSDDATTPGDPVLTFALFGAGARVTPREVVDGPGSGCMTIRYRIRVPAHATRHLLFFTQMSETNEQAIARAPKFDAPTERMLTGLSPKVRAAIVNWDLS